jgi:GNAT superfamily N-acetyltransferase
LSFLRHWLIPGNPQNQRMTSTPSFTLRPAELRDVSAIVHMIRELAEFEKLAHLVQVTPEKLRPHLFGEKPAAALFFTNFSTFLAQPGLYLEDLYVKPPYRHLGIGRALLKRLAQLAVERGHGRFDWSVLDWNANAIGFYEKLGAVVMPDWRICRVTGDALGALAAA